MIVYITGRADWPAPQIGIDPAAGFVHCSDPGSVLIPARRLFAGRRDLLLLEIDPALVGVPVRWEPGDPPEPGGPWFPHVYGPIPASAVVAVHDFPCDGEGFRLPESLAVR
ncbi:DUF952 domain-containing protein [Actinokineospora sp. G85]|uniref:DUF952 domain-containing protein n=1 Tax=Actinokineospora sp. G85 TaxID=3406626 RepID=UPI003C768787